MSFASFLWGISGPFLAVYVVIQNLNIPLILQPHIFAFLCAVSWAQVGNIQSRRSSTRLNISQCLFYGRKWPLKRCIVYFIAFIAVMAGFEAGMIYAVEVRIQFQERRFD